MLRHALNTAISREVSVSGVSGVSGKFESRWLTVSSVSSVSGVSGRRFLAMRENSEQIASKLLHIISEGNHV